MPGYDPRRFLAVNPGDLLNNRYNVVTKLGWGTSSTVWLAQDTRRYVFVLFKCKFSLLYRWWWSPNQYVTLKVTASDSVDKEIVRHERIITQHIEKNPSHDGFRFVRTFLDSFEAPGQDGPHLCMVYEPMRESLELFVRRWENGKLPVALVKVYLRFFLRGLDYLHSECQIIHTGKIQFCC